MCSSDSQKVPTEGSKVGVAETGIARRGAENSDKRMVVESDFTKILSNNWMRCDIWTNRG